MRVFKGKSLNVSSARRVILLGIRSGCALGALTISNLALAQSAPAEDAAAESVPADSEIIVTGSQIRGVASTGSDSVSISSAEILSSGSNSASEMLKRIPQVTTFGADESNRSTNQGGNANRTYGTAVNLRGLGPSATLVLINGHRVPTSGLQGQYVDPSIIPTSVISRLEIVPDGASAIYGSDAVAGVANVITRRGFDGVQVSGRYGLADGYDDYQAGFIAGHEFDRGSILFAYDFSGHTRLAGAERSFFTANLTSFGGRDNRTNLAVPGNISANNTTYALPAGNGIVTPAQLVAGSVNRRDQYLGQDIIPSQKKHSAFAAGSLELTDGLTAKFDAYFSKRDYEYFDPAPTATLAVPRTNPFFVSPIVGAASVNVLYSFANDIGNASVTGFSKSYGGNFGLTQKLFGDWQINAQVTIGRDDEQYLANAVLRTVNLTPALADSNPATAFNPFGSGGISNPATVAGLIGFADTRSSFFLHQYLAKADGSLFELPGGTVKLAFGGEYRRERLSNTAVDNRRTATPVTASASVAQRSVKAVFAEMAIPLVGGDFATPGVQSLDLSVAVRYEDYSDFGATTNPKFGLTWVPVDGLRLRATYGTSFRAPTLSDIDPLSSGGGIFALNNIVDPLATSGRSSGISIAGGNPNVGPENATTWTAGFDLKPEGVEGLHLSATYFAIKDSNLIGFLQGSTTFLIQESLYSQFITRNPTLAQINAVLNSGLPINSAINPATVTFILDGRRQNFGETRMNGIDFDLGYDFDTSFGRINTGVFGSYLTKLITKPAASAPFRDVRGTINWPATFRARANIGWKSGIFSAQAYLNYVNGYNNDLVTPVERVKSYATFDLSFVIDTSKDDGNGVFSNTTVALTAQNLFNRMPPFVNNPAGFGWDPQVHGALGRLVSLTVTRKF